jgi:hypothetical protein
MVSGRHAALQPVAEDLRQIFGERLEAFVAYGWRQNGPVPSLALVRSLAFDDLNRCAARAGVWARGGAATPLLLTRADFARSLDAFPIEYGEIIDSHDVIVGDNPFDGLSIPAAELRRACEVQAKSHLLHLRENYIEAGGRRADIEALVRDSAPAFAALLTHLARLDGGPSASGADLAKYAVDRIGLDAHVVSDLLSLGQAEALPAVDAIKLFPSYLVCMERLAEFVDRWHRE